jgi:hypothetical protein
MHVNQIILTSILLTIFAITLGCAGNTAPKGWLSSVVDAESESYGAWIEVRHSNGSINMITEGELIALDTIQIYILSETNFYEIPISEIIQAKLTAYKSNKGVLGMWTFLGCLSTGSHGMLAGISLPTWILAGSILTGTQSHQPVEKYPKVKWNSFKKFARFPQGLPPDVDLDSLKPKPQKIRTKDGYKIIE